jgi:hypothetical protein
VWRLAWNDYSGWCWYRDIHGRLAGLRLACRTGGYEEIRLWGNGQWSLARRVLDAMEPWAPGRGELPGMAQDPREASFQEVKGAFVLGLIVLLGFGGVIFLGMLWSGGVFR